MSSIGSPRGSDHALLHTEQVSFLHAAKGHKRSKLRAIAIVSVAVGLVMNFTTLMVALTARNSRDPALITGIAFIPLVLSMLWHHVDLLSQKLLGRELPLPQILFMDSLGFLGFLAILITNGIIGSNYDNVRWGGVKPIPALMIYNSVPWLVCCSVHLIIVHREVLENLKTLYGIRHQGNGCSHCTHCRSQWSAQTRKPAAGAGYSFLSAHEQYDEDTEANRASVSVEETRQMENTPLTAAAGDSA